MGTAKKTKTKTTKAVSFVRITLCVLHYFIVTNLHLCDLLKHIVQVQRGYGYSPEELLILTKSYMTISDNPTAVTNQMAFAFWTQVHIMYNKNIGMTSKKSENNLD